MEKIIQITNTKFESNNIIIEYNNLVWDKQNLYLKIWTIINKYYQCYPTKEEIEIIKSAMNLVINVVVNGNDNYLLNLYEDKLIPIMNNIKKNITVDYEIKWLWIIKKRIEIIVKDNTLLEEHNINIDLPWFAWTDIIDLKKNTKGLVWLIKTILLSKSYDIVKNIETIVRTELKKNPIIVAFINKDNSSEQKKIFWDGEIKHIILNEDQLTKYWENINWWWKDVIKLKLKTIKNNKTTNEKDFTLNIVKFWGVADNTVNDILKNLSYTKYEIDEMSIKGDTSFDFNIDYTNNDKSDKITTIKTLLEKIF